MVRNNKKFEKMLDEQSTVESEGRIVNEEVFTKMKQELVKWGGPELEKYDPVIELAKMANDPSNDDKLRAMCNREVASYMYPKVKSYEIKGKMDSNVNVTITVKSFGKKGHVVEVSPEDINDVTDTTTKGLLKSLTKH